MRPIRGFQVWWVTLICLLIAFKDIWFLLRVQRCARWYLCYCLYCLCVIVNKKTKTKWWYFNKEREKREKVLQYVFFSSCSPVWCSAPVACWEPQFAHCCCCRRSWVWLRQAAASWAWPPPYWLFHIWLNINMKYSWTLFHKH